MIKRNLLTIVFLTSLWCSGKSLTKTNVNQSIASDSLQVKSPEQLVTYLKNSNSQKSKIFEIALSTLALDPLILAEHYYDISEHYYDKGQFDRNIYYLNNAVKSIKHTENDSMLSKYFIGLGNGYLKDWKNQKSLDYYNKGLNIAYKYNNTRNQFIANSGKAIILKRMEKLDKALKVCKNSLNILEKSEDKNTKNHVRMLTIISEIYLDQKKYDSVLHYTDLGLIISKELDYSIGSIDLYTKKGIVALNKNEQAEAWQYFRKAEKILIKNEVTQKKSILNLYYFIAKSLYKEKEYDSAISYLNSCISILEEKDSRNIRALDIYILLANCYTETGKTNEAMHWFQKINKLKDQFQDAKDKTITQLYNQEIDDLKNQIEIHKNKEIRQERYKELAFFILLIVSVVLFFIVLKYFRNQKNNKKRFNELIEKINVLESKEKNLAQAVVINDDKVTAVLKGLEKLENQEYFLNTDCDLRSMSKKVKTNTTYLSKIIKTHKATSFNDYINNLRIEYALKRLKNDKKFRSFSVKSIALEIGYKTDNSFTKHFKSKTGLNPSYYIKKINNQNEI
ncbi:response regulator transcription factor [Aquimarina sp. Aq107]|uniref:response regulator transcription factor n=1 Tax=Aquimarina sp. Aq107 TaxID=1191912 RepID=UPI000D561A11|nr:response regulator transcription factor [Aquimarina sp. Aq107]